jgi:hypothetical protein
MSADVDRPGSGVWDVPEDREAERIRAVDRLRDLVRLHAEVEVMTPDARPVPLGLLRRAVFAAYRAALLSGANHEAASLLGGAGRGIAGSVA